MTEAAPGEVFERVVRDAMERTDLSLLGLARETGIDRRRYYSWFRGDNAPTPRTMERVSAVLGLSVDELLAPWGSGRRRGAGIVTDPAPLAALTAAINRLDAALEGRTEQLAPETAEGIAQARARASEADPQPSPRRR